MNACRRNDTGLVPTNDFLTWTERAHIRKQLLAQNIPLCIWCQAEVGDHKSDNYFSADHIIPRCDGGAYEVSNLVLSCKSCNLERGNMSVLQYLAHRAGCEPSRSNAHDQTNPRSSV